MRQKSNSIGQYREHIVSIVSFAGGKELHPGIHRNVDPQWYLPENTVKAVAVADILSTVMMLTIIIGW